MVEDAAGADVLLRGGENKAVRSIGAIVEQVLDFAGKLHVLCRVAQNEVLEMRQFVLVEKRDEFRQELFPGLQPPVFQGSQLRQHGFRGFLGAQGGQRLFRDLEPRLWRRARQHPRGDARVGRNPNIPAVLGVGSSFVEQDDAGQVIHVGQVRQLDVVGSPGLRDGDAEAVGREAVDPDGWRRLGGRGQGVEQQRREGRNDAGPEHPSGKRRSRMGETGHRVSRVMVVAARDSASRERQLASCPAGRA